MESHGKAVNEKALQQPLQPDIAIQWSRDKHGKTVNEKAIMMGLLV